MTIEGGSNDPDLDDIIRENLAGERTTADIDGSSQLSGQPGQTLRRILRDKILLRLRWAGLIKKQDSKEEEY